MADIVFNLMGEDYILETPVAMGWENAKSQTDTAALQQLESGGTAFRWRQRWTLTDEFGNKRLGANFEAHRLLYGKGDPWAAPIVQHLGIDIPTNAIRATSAGVVNSERLVINNATGIQVGLRFKLANHQMLYSVVGVSGRTLTIRPGLKSAVPANTALEFTGTVSAKHAKEARDEMVYEEGALISVSFDVLIGA